MQALYHHRTQGKGVEAVHIHGFCGGLQALGYAVEIVGPPGVMTDPDLVVASEEGRSGSRWGLLARHAPQLVFELLEIGYNLAAIPRLWRRCRALKPDLICERYALYNFSGVLVACMTGIPIALEVNDTVRNERTRQGKSLAMPWLAARIERRIFRAATGIAVVSGFLKGQVAELGVAPQRIQVTPNAVDSRWFDPRKADAEAVRSRWGLQHKTVIGFAGSFTKWHAVDLLVRAAAELVPEFPDLHLLLVGDGAKRAETEALVAELNMTARAHFTGKLPHSEMPGLMAAMDIGVMPESNPFGSPMKVFEYMAMGCPAVGPRYGPLEEAIEDGVTGMLFEPRNQADLTRCLRSLLADPTRRRQLGSQARQKVLNRHLWRHNAQAVVDLVCSPGRPLPDATAAPPTHGEQA